VNLLITYYSREGSTAQIARGLAQATGGTLRKLVDSRRMENGGMFRALIATVLGLGTTLVDPETPSNRLKRSWS
jgi:flavodoxin